MTHSIGLAQRLTSCKRPRLLAWDVSLLGLFAVVSVRPVVAYADAAPPGEVLHVNAGAVKVDIPREYMPSAAVYDHPHRFYSFHIFARLPDLRGAGLDRAEFSRPGWHSQVSIQLNYGDQFLSLAYRAAHHPDGHDLSADSYTMTDAGCKLYQPTRHSWNDLYECPEAGAEDGRIILTCSTASSVPFPYCSVSENISSDVSIRYSLSRAYVENAVGIDQRIRHLVQSFISNKQIP